VTTLIDSRMLTRLTPAFYADTVTIQQRTDTADTYGQMIPSWANVVALTTLPCRIAVSSGPSPDIAERPGADKTIVTVSHQISIAGYYPAITVLMRAVVGGVNYDIVAVEHDSEGVTTRLRVKLVTT
jgi:head-tail adaptor